MILLYTLSYTSGMTCDNPLISEVRDIAAFSVITFSEYYQAIPLYF
jgi:hypothetical protein